MVIVETIGRVRREHFARGKTIKEIARDLKISRNTVRKILRSEETSFSYDREVQPRPKLENWSAELDRLLTTNATSRAGAAHADPHFRRVAPAWLRRRL